MFPNYLALLYLLLPKQLRLNERIDSFGAPNISNTESDRNT